MRPARPGLVLSTLVAGLGLGLAGLQPIGNSDTFGHLAAGRQIAELGRVPALDGFSFFRPTPQPWVNYEWLSGLLFHGVFAAGGYDALIGLSVGLLALLAALLVRRAYDREGAYGAWSCALLLLLAIPGARYRFSVRPHLLGLVLSALYLLGLLRITEPDPARGGSSRPWRWVVGLALAHLLWVNLHGSHLFGLVLTALALAAHARQAAVRKRLLALLGLQGLASCISPYGPRIVVDAIAHVADPAYRRIVEEWQAWSPDRPLWLLLAVLLQIVLLLVASRGLARGPERTFCLASSALLAVMALRSLRFIPDFLLLTAPFVAAGLAPRFRAWPADAARRVLPVSLLCMVLLVPFGARQLPPGGAFGGGVDSSAQPSAAGEWLARQLPDARVFAAMEDSWYLMFAAPRARFLLDGRAPFYGPAHMQAMMRAWVSAELLRRTLDESEVDVVVLQPAFRAHQLALVTLERAPEWHLVLIEDRHCMFARALPGRERLLAESTIRTLTPRYDALALLARDFDVAGARAELGRLPDHPNTRAYRAFVGAILSLRPLARAEGRAGFSAPRDASEHAQLANALQGLRSADELLRVVPTVAAYHALIAALSCELEEAREALERASSEEDSRETLFTSQELALRAGDGAELRRFLHQARALPEARDDPWLDAIEQGLSAPPVCAR